MTGEVQGVHDGDAMRAFVGRVQSRCGLAEAEARVLARVTLTHLGGQVSAARAEALGATLPQELADALRAGVRRVGVFDEDAFLDAVSAHLPASEPGEVEERVRAVLSIVRTWAPRGLVESTLAQLPPPLAVMFA